MLERIHNLDVAAFLWVNVTHRCQYRKTVRFISRTGDGPLYIILSVCLYLWGGERGQQFFNSVLLAYIADVSLYLLCKNLIRRDRPSVGLNGFDAWITPSDKFSFPSGHTAAAFVFAVIVAEFYPAFAALVFIWAVLIGLSRVLQGVHYPTDILAGSALGSSCAIFALMALGA